MITKLELQNFRCFSHHIVPFRHLTVAVGQNNAGKSTVVEALRLVALVASRYASLHAHEAPEWLALPVESAGVSPSLRGLDLNFSTIFHQYGEPPAIIQATLDDDYTIGIYLGLEQECYAIVRDGIGEPADQRQWRLRQLTHGISILPQIAPLANEEKILKEKYVMASMASRLSSLHFRNQILLLHERFERFKALAEISWDGLVLERPEVVTRGQDPVIWQLVRDKDFAAEVGVMGHGLQMWLQIM